VKTKFQYSIRARLRWVVFALITSLTILFGACILLLVFRFERTLFYNHLESDLDTYIEAYAGANRAVEVEMADTKFYKFPSDDNSFLPESFRDYPEGNFEIVEGMQAYNLFVRHHPAWTFALVQDQSQFERYELLVISAVIFGTILISALGFILSQHIATQVLLPILTLARAVEDKPSPEVGPWLNPDNYPNDEVGSLASAIERYSKQVSALLQREKQFTADVSHELRTPMMAVQGATDVIREHTHTKDPVLTRAVERIERAIADMRDQIALYLQLGRDPDALKSESSINLLEAAEAARALWLPRAQAKGLALIMQEPTGRANRNVPSTLINAVLNNLLQNAINHTERGDIIITVKDSRIMVQDSGGGVDPKIAHQIFERGVRSPTGAASSYGIGLSIVKRICDHQGWSLDVHPAVPTGSIFSVSL